MATLSPGLFTYAEWAIRMDPDGKTSVLVDLLSQNNGILEDMLAVECQNGVSFEFKQVTSLPTPSRRIFNQGVARTMATAAPQVVVAIQYADWAVIDDGLARLNGQIAEVRAQEDALHLEGISQKVASDLFYANRATDPTAFTGFANIYSTVTTSTSQIANNVIDCGGTGSTNASMWLITWGPRHLHTIFPKGMPSGLVHRDICPDGYPLPYADSNGNEFLAWRTWMEWNIGVAVHDWRFGARACNIDYTTFGTGNAPNLISTLVALCMKLPIMPAGVGPVQTSDAPDKLVMGRSCIYVNRTVYLALDLQALNKTNVLLKMDQWDGEPTLTFRGVPIRIVDALTTTESRVV